MQPCRKSADHGGAIGEVCRHVLQWRQGNNPRTSSGRTYLITKDNIDSAEVKACKDCGARQFRRAAQGRPDGRPPRHAGRFQGVPGGRPVLTDVSLTLGAGKFGIVGENGAGSRRDEDPGWHPRPEADLSG